MHVPVEVAERARAAAAEHGVDAGRERRRRVDHGPGQGGRADDRAADRRGAHDVRRLRGHQRLGPDRGRPQDHRRRPPGAAPRRRLRRRADCCPCRCRPERRLRAQRAGALRRLDVGARAPTRSTRRSPLEGIRGAAPRACRRSSRDPPELDGREQTPLRRLPVRGRVRLGRLGPAPQDLPRARRHVRPAARRRPTPSCCRTCWRFNAPAAPEAERRLAAAFGADVGASTACSGCAHELDAPTRAARPRLAPRTTSRAPSAPILAAVPAGNPRP